MNNLNFKKVRERTHRISTRPPAVKMVMIKGKLRKLPKAFLSHRHPSGRHRYCKRARGRGTPVYHILGGMKHNYYRRTGRCIPKFSPLMPPRVPPIVSGLMQAFKAGKEKPTKIADILPRDVKPKGNKIDFSISIDAPRKAPANGNAIRPLENAPSISITVHPSFKTKISLVQETPAVRQERVQVIRLTAHPDYNPRIVQVPQPRPDLRADGPTAPQRMPDIPVHDIRAERPRIVPAQRARAGATQVKAPGNRKQPNVVLLADYRPGIISFRKAPAGPKMNVSKYKPGSEPARGSRVSIVQGRVFHMPSRERHAQPLRGCGRQGVGYIQSGGKKRIRQLKVAQGAEGIPPKQ